MPSSKNYVRDYAQERKTSNARGEYEGIKMRMNARYKLEKEGRVKKNDGKDIDHKKPISKGGTNAPKNLRVVKASSNRSYKRNAKKPILQMLKDTIKSGQFTTSGGIRKSIIEKIQTAPLPIVSQFIKAPLYDINKAKQEIVDKMLIRYIQANNQVRNRLLKGK